MRKSEMEPLIGIMKPCLSELYQGKQYIRRTDSMHSRFGHCDDLLESFDFCVACVLHRILRTWDPDE